jgi:hypothetical protein
MLKKISVYMNSMSELGTQQHVGIRNTMFSATHWSATRVGLMKVILKCINMPSD